MQKFGTLATCVGLAIATVSSAQAATVIADGNGTANSADCTFGCVTRYQQMYSSALFSGVNDITSLSFFVADNSPTSAFANSIYQLSLSTAATSLGSMSSTFASNAGSDATIFDVITLNGSLAGGSAITFNGSFAYDASLGDLLVDIQHLSGPRLSTNLSYNQGGDTDGEYMRLYSFGGTTSGYSPAAYGNLTSFEVSPVSPVPLPAGVWMLGLGLAGLGALRRKAA
ncbi:VPLPA-CTERM sorting domain-containing protein [Citreicella sp. C3M06]|uniref:VPLPA-CTERM sorting domain-containing protein n=1 Tax=Citreicella sp. C3M06 TaxID=2841564 RepID=UPI0020914E2C|nr:VPLPA-CTERM sorting domain-containing protein [Citreicella sp. C3M06]